MALQGPSELPGFLLVGPPPMNFTFPAHSSTKKGFAPTFLGFWEPPPHIQIHAPPCKYYPHGQFCPHLPKKFAKSGGISGKSGGKSGNWELKLGGSWFEFIQISVSLS